MRNGANGFVFDSKPKSQTTDVQVQPLHRCSFGVTTQCEHHVLGGKKKTFRVSVLKQHRWLLGRLLEDYHKTNTLLNSHSHFLQGFVCSLSIVSTFPMRGNVKQQFTAQHLPNGPKPGCQTQFSPGSIGLICSVMSQNVSGPLGTGNAAHCWQ